MRRNRHTGQSGGKCIVDNEVGKADGGGGGGGGVASQLGKS
jgi:hypothetical protein